MIWDTCVKIYLALIQNGCPGEWRPTRCRRCGAESKFHRHGQYTRMLYTLEEALEIIIFRFRCTACSKTFGLLPPFLIPHRTAALDVQEQVVRELDGGTPLREVAEGLVRYYQWRHTGWAGRLQSKTRIFGRFFFLFALLFAHRTPHGIFAAHLKIFLYFWQDI
jgi:hypothetical protein